MMYWERTGLLRVYAPRNDEKANAPEMTGELDFFVANALAMTRCHFVLLAMTEETGRFVANVIAMTGNADASRNDGESRNDVLVKSWIASSLTPSQ